MTNFVSARQPNSQRHPEQSVGNAMTEPGLEVEGGSPEVGDRIVAVATRMGASRSAPADNAKGHRVEQHRVVGNKSMLSGPVTQ